MLNPVAYQSLFRAQGYRVRVWRALPHECVNVGDGYDEHRTCTDPRCELGFIYLEEPLAADVRVALDTVREAIIHPQFGALTVGDVMLTAMPDQLYLRSMDKLLLADWKQGLVEQVTKGADELLRPWAVGVQQVRTTTTIYGQGVSWSLDVDEDTGASCILWADGTPQPGEGEYYVVSYLYAPLYWVDPASDQTGRPTAGSSLALPRAVKLSKERPANHA